VIFVDLDDFKAVNDGLGHHAGDKLLIEVARRLRACMRATDAPIRLGGEEFAILLPGLVAGAERLAGRILLELSLPFSVGGAEAHVGASIGIAGAGGSLDEALRHADAATYAAKKHGKQRWVAFDPAMHSAAPQGGPIAHLGWGGARAGATVERGMTPLRSLLVLAAVALAALPAAAHATDSHAPRGARGDWLPADDWVMSQWLPYDEASLHRLLRTDRAELAAWLDDRRTLGQLARRRGFRSQRALAARLVAARGQRLSAAWRRVLERRALDTLTQAHLARHVLFHIYHSPAVAQAAPRVFGMSAARYRRLRDSGRSPRRIAAAGGRTEPQLRAALLRMLAARGHRAVRLRAMSPRQARTLLSEQTAGVDAFMRRPYRTTNQQRDYAALVCHLPAVD
jgi:diguanylate cyclase (GGDEF)-like protein